MRNPQVRFLKEKKNLCGLYGGQIKKKKIKSIRIKNLNLKQMEKASIIS